MPVKNAHQHALVLGLERTLMAFLLLAMFFVAVVYVVAPSIYTNTLLFQASPTDRYPFSATLFLIGIVIGIAVVMVGVVRHWRWLFWLLLIAFGFSILEIPATILQLTGVLPGLIPVWYSLCRMGVALIQGAIAAWMVRIYRRRGVWAMGKKKPTRP
jgi:uncharacterized membrane protein YidH (DUF202 family)